MQTGHRACGEGLGHMQLLKPVMPRSESFNIVIETRKRFRCVVNAICVLSTSKQLSFLQSSSNNGFSRVFFRVR